MTEPVCSIVAGPNGAGKTTFALEYLREFTSSRNFINADMIATGLSPFSIELPPKQQPANELAANRLFLLAANRLFLLEANRLFLKEIRHNVAERQDFAFETTLSGRLHLRLIRRMLADGWRVDLYYLWLPSVALSIDRIAERVAHGGHYIPDEAARRRYPRSISNLLNHFAPLCSRTMCLDNTKRPSELIFTQNSAGRKIVNEKLYEQLMRGV